MCCPMVEPPLLSFLGYVVLVHNTGDDPSPARKFVDSLSAPGTTCEPPAA